MKIKISLLIFYSITLVGSIMTLFSVKSTVILQKKELNWLNNQILQEITNIQILQAELTYLTTPERINRLQKKYLALESITTDQFETLEEK